MYNYLIGAVREIGIDSVILEVNGIGYQLQVAHPDQYRREEIAKIFTHLQVRDDGWTLYGFKTKEERELFLRLINVSGIGPKTAIGILAGTSTQSLIQAIETSNTSYLKQLPGIGPKAAQQIILDLKGKLVFDSYTKLDTNQALEDTKAALKTLGFKNSEIDRVVAKIGKEKMNAEEYLKEALQLLRK